MFLFLSAFLLGSLFAGSESKDDPYWGPLFNSSVSNDSYSFSPSLSDKIKNDPTIPWQKNPNFSLKFKKFELGSYKNLMFEDGAIFFACLPLCGKEGCLPSRYCILNEEVALWDELLILKNFNVGLVGELGQVCIVPSLTLCFNLAERYFFYFVQCAECKHLAYPKNHWFEKEFFVVPKDLTLKFAPRYVVSKESSVYRDGNYMCRQCFQLEFDIAGSFFQFLYGEQKKISFKPEFFAYDYNSREAFPDYKVFKEVFSLFDKYKYVKLKENVLSSTKKTRRGRRARQEKFPTLLL